MTTTRRAQVSTDPLRDDVSHEAVGVMPALAAFKLEREGERRREVIRIGGRELFVAGVGHPMMTPPASALKSSIGAAWPRGRRGRRGQLRSSPGTRARAPRAKAPRTQAR